MMVQQHNRYNTIHVNIIINKQYVEILNYILLQLNIVIKLNRVQKKIPMLAYYNFGEAINIQKKTVL